MNFVVLIILVYTIFIVIMELRSFQDNSHSILIKIRDVVLRCDLHQRYLDHLYITRHAHQRVLKSQPLKHIADYDIEELLQQTHALIKEFTIPTYHIINVYRHDRNDRFVLLETSGSLRIELDKELNGIKDRSRRTYSNMYKRRPDNYYKGAAVKEYQRILHEMTRTFELAVRIIRLKSNNT